MVAPNSQSFELLRSTAFDTQAIAGRSGAISPYAVARGLQDPIHETPSTSRSSSSFRSNTAYHYQSGADIDANSLIRNSTFSPDNSSSGIQNLGTLAGTRTAINAVGTIDTQDYYQFHLDYTSQFNLSLTGLSADADVELLDRNGTVIAGSYRSNNWDEAINRASLAAGNYFLRVFQFSGDTTYQLNVSVGSPSNLLPVETNLGTLNSGVNNYLNGWISTSNTSDVYQFNLAGTSNLNMTLYGLSADFDLRLIRDANRNGVVDLGEEIVRSISANSTAEVINLQGLGAGSYLAQVYQWAGTIAGGSYNLAVRATLNLGWATEANNTINTAYDLGTLNGDRRFSGWVSGNSNYYFDDNDFYSFTLNTTSDITLSLTGLSADADLEIIQDANNNGWVDSGEVVAGSYRYGSTAELIDLYGLQQGNYLVRVSSYLSAATSYVLKLTGTAVDRFASFNVFDASGDLTSTTVFDDGALRFSYDLAGTATIASVRLEAINGNGVTNLGTFYGSSLVNGLINLANFASITAGQYELRAIAQTTNGTEFLSGSQTINVLPWLYTGGTFQAELFNYSAALGTGSVFLGRGGTDFLNLGLTYSSIASINGLNLATYNPLTNSTWSQAIFGGSSFDYITLTDGREIYFQGIENLLFADGSTFELQVRPNDPISGLQWNLHVSDVGNAWRFTQGASNVMLVSLDTGIRAGDRGTINDIGIDRVITSMTDTTEDNNHGHQAISVMAGSGNNGFGVAGINWNSAVYVSDVYGGINLHQAIRDAINYARATNQRIVFQGGIQGEGWLNYGGSRAELEQLIRENSDIAVFAVAAGNGGPGGNLDDPNYLNSVSGVAAMEKSHDNVIAVGAARPGSESNHWYITGNGIVTIDGLVNATSISLASYSNRGSNLTLVAATDSPAITETGNGNYFGGTSCANPNMAGIASLVWSVNASLDGGEVRQILIDTAMDLGASGRDNTFGNGLVNADAAIRRAAALGRRYDLASLYSGTSVFA